MIYSNKEYHLLKRGITESLKAFAKELTANSLTNNIVKTNFTS